MFNFFCLETKVQDLDFFTKNKSCSLKILNLRESLFFIGSDFASRFGQENFLNVHRTYFFDTASSDVVFKKFRPHFVRPKLFLFIIRLELHFRNFSFNDQICFCCFNNVFYRNTWCSFHQLESFRSYIQNG